MRFKKANDAFREQWNVIPEDITETDKGLLDQMLSNVIESFRAQGVTDYNKYYSAFIECVESVFPDEPWYENLGLDIRQDLFNTQNPEITKQHILDSIIEPMAYVEAEDKVLQEDTIQKSNGKWTNRGDNSTKYEKFDIKRPIEEIDGVLYAYDYLTQKDLAEVKDIVLKLLRKEFPNSTFEVYSIRLIDDALSMGVLKDDVDFNRGVSVELSRFDYRDNLNKVLNNYTPQLAHELIDEMKATIFDMSTEESLKEDTVRKSNGKWTNRGKDGKEHGEFKTKKAADAQRCAMYANGYKGESLKESTNPENAEINKIIYDVATGKSKAIQKLKKLGYEVEIDDKARKEFGRKYFGDTIRIINPKTGNSIVGNTGTSEYGYVSGDFLRANSKYGKSHILKSGRYNKEVTADRKDFDYKTFLDKKHDEPLSKETTISQFKKDKKLIDDNQNLYKQLKDADDRLSSIRSKIKSRNDMSESKFDEPTSIGKGYAAPITTDLRRHRIKDDLKYINDENPSYSRVARNDLVRAYNEILAEIEEVEEFDAYWAEHKKALMSELKAQLDLIPADIRD